MEMAISEMLQSSTGAPVMASTNTEAIASVEDLVSRFGPWDYTVFAGMLSVSAVIGFYYACSGGKQSTTSEFLLGNR